MVHLLQWSNRHKNFINDSQTICLFKKQSCRKRRDRNVPPASSHSRRQQWPWARIHVRLPHGWWDPSHWAILHYSPRPLAGGWREAEQLATAAVLYRCWHRTWQASPTAPQCCCPAPSRSSRLTGLGGSCIVLTKREGKTLYKVACLFLFLFSTTLCIIYKPKLHNSSKNVVFMILINLLNIILIKCFRWADTGK